MTVSDDFGAWAAAFFRRLEAEDGAAGVSGGAVPPPHYRGVTAEACRLLESVDAGGVPAFVTQNLLRIARDNGLAPASATAPDEIVAALRRLATRTTEDGVG